MGEHTVEPFVTAASGLGGALERLLCWSLMSPGGQYSTLHHYNIAAICSLWLHRLQHQQRFNLNHLRGYVVFQDRKATSFLSPLYNLYAQTFECRDRQKCLNFDLKLPFSRLVLLGHKINKSRRFSRSIFFFSIGRSASPGLMLGPLENQDRLRDMKPYSSFDGGYPPTVLMLGKTHGKSPSVPLPC